MFITVDTGKIGEVDASRLDVHCRGLLRGSSCSRIWALLMLLLLVRRSAKSLIAQEECPATSP